MLFLSLLFVVGLFCGSVLSAVIYYLPLRLKNRWLKESLLYLRLNRLGALQLRNAERLPLAKASGKQGRSLKNYFAGASICRWWMNKGRHRRRCGGLTYCCRVELITAIMTLLVYWRFQSVSLTLAGLLFSYWLIMLMFIDFRHLLLPDELTLTLLWLGLIVNLNHMFVSLNDAVIGAIAGYLFLWGFYWFAKLVKGIDGLGYGDFKLMSAMGAWLGWQVLSEILFLGCALGLMCTVGVVYVYKDKAILKRPIPLGGYLSWAGLIVLLEA